MANVSSDLLVGLLTNWQAIFARDFDAALQSAWGNWQELVVRMTSPGEINTYVWAGSAPQMEDVTHKTSSIRAMEDYSFSLTNREYQATIELERMLIERDQLNLFLPKVQGLAGEAARHPGELIFSLFEDNPNAYDATAFFADTRTIGESANIDNILVGTGTTVAQIQTDLAAARSQMRLYEDDRGRPMNLLGNTIVIPPALEQPFWQALNVNQAGSQDRQAIPATSNGVLNGSGYAVIVNPYLTDVNNWYLLHVGLGMMRPFIFQVEKEPVLKSDTNATSRENILQRKFLYSVYGRYTVGVTDPRLAIRTTNT